MTTPTPNSDPTIQAIALYLQGELNAALDSIEPGAIAVQGIRDHYTKLNSADSFPLLMVYRRNGNRRESTVVVDYYLPAYNGNFPQPGIMNWARYQLTLALQGYDGVNRCVKVDGGQEFPYQMLFSPLDRSVHPLVRLTLTIEEIF